MYIALQYISFISFSLPIALSFSCASLSLSRSLIYNMINRYECLTYQRVLTFSRLLVSRYSLALIEIYRQKFPSQILFYENHWLVLSIDSTKINFRSFIVARHCLHRDSATGATTVTASYSKDRSFLYLLFFNYRIYSETIDASRI